MRPVGIRQPPVAIRGHHLFRVESDAQPGTADELQPAVHHGQWPYISEIVERITLRQPGIALVIVKSQALFLNDDVGAAEPDLQ